MSKHLRAVLIGLVLGTFGLFSCSDRSLTASASDDSMGGFGKAVIQLPDLSSSALSKLPIGVDTNALTLLIVAPDMDTMKYSWPVTSLKGQKVEIDGIPSGANRYFEGFLTNKSGILTHTGKVAVRIIAGQNVPVNLKLSGLGGADVCIEIEGYPSSCNSIDSLIINSCLSGSTISASGPVTGNIQLYVYGGKTSGQMILTSPKSNDVFQFNRPLQVIDSANLIFCQGIVLNITTKTNQFLQLIRYNANDFVIYIYTDSTQGGPVYAKLSSTKCTVMDTLKINTCLKGTTPEVDSLKGNLQLYIYGEKPSGQLTLVSSTNKSVYIFTRPVKIIDSAKQKQCQTIVLNTSTGKSHFLMMFVNSYSEILYGIINADTTTNSLSIAKFYSVKCQDTAYTINVNTCLTGYTPRDSLTGNLQLSVYGEKTSGQFTLVSSTDKNTYIFNKPIQIADSVGQKFCQTVVLNSVTRKYHGLKMIINKSSEITYGYLSEDSNVHNNAIAKFFSAKCNDTIPDTQTVNIQFRGNYSYPDSGIFSATMNVFIENKKAIGQFYFQNFPVIKPNPIKVSGTADLNIGYMNLTATTSPFYRIDLKIHSGMYDALIYDENGFVIGSMKNYGSY